MVYIERITLARGTPILARPEVKHNELPGDAYWTDDVPVTPGWRDVYVRGGSEPKAPPCVFLGSGDINEKIVLEGKLCDIDSKFFGYSGWTIRIFNADDHHFRCRHQLDEFGYSWEFHISGSTATFRLVYDAEIPLGVFGTYRFVLRGTSTMSHIEQELGTLPLEFYALSVSELPEIFKVDKKFEVPLMMLRMFVLPQRWVNEYHSPSTWIKLVVDIVHGKRSPFDGSPSATCDHWLKYDSSHGAPSFTTGYGTKGFNMQAWLDAYRNRKQNGTFTYINCYDQAGITELALCLGINHKQIHWEYNQLYGFIGSNDPSKAELVGWGPCNNPYFENDISRMTIADDDSRRTPFRNHAYLSWSKKPMTKVHYEAYNAWMTAAKNHDAYSNLAPAFEKAYGLELFMIDACGGPHYGTQTRTDYEANLQLIRDPITGSFKDSLFSKYIRDHYRNPKMDWDEDHHLGAGVSIINDDPEWRLGNQLSKEKVEEYKKTVQLVLSMLVKPDTTYRIQKERISPVQDIFRNHIKDLAQVVGNKWARYSEVPIRPYTTDDGTTVHEIKFCYTENDTKPLDGQVAMRVAFNSPGEIQKACASHLAYTALTSFHWLVKDRGPLQASGSPSSISAAGTYYRRAFVWFNASVEVFMDKDHMWPNNSLMQTLLTKLDGLKEHT